MHINDRNIKPKTNQTKYTIQVSDKNRFISKDIIFIRGFVRNGKATDDTNLIHTCCHQYKISDKIIIEKGITIVSLIVNRSRSAFKSAKVTLIRRT